MRLIFIHIFNGAALRDYFWIPSRVYLRLHISCYTRAYPIFFGLRRVPNGVVPLRLVVFIDLIVIVDLFDIAPFWGRSSF